MSRPGERGSATVHAVVLAGVLTSLAVGCAVGGGILVGQRRAAAAADMAALAGAAAVQSGGALGGGAGDACARASSITEANGAVLVACDVAGEEVLVRVEVAAPIGPSWTVSARARAGPVGGVAQVPP